MTDRFELVDAGDDTVLDVVTFNGDEVSFDTGEAESLVASRRRLIPDREALLASLDGWSNGYLLIRRADVEVQATAADPDAQRLQEQWEAAKDRLLRRWPKLAAPMVDELAAQAEAAIAAGDVSALAELEVSAGVVAAVAVPIRTSGTELAAEAAAGVVEEAARQQVTVTVPAEAGAERVRQHADVVARIIANGYASGAARVSLQLAGAGPQEVRDEVERHLTELGESTNGLVGDNVGQLLSAAQHAGRLAVLEQNPAREYVANESNDDRNRCDNCRQANGRRYKSLRDALADYQVNGLKSCDGRGRCRGFLSPLW